MTEREGDGLKVIDTSNALTKEELQELKRLASMSKMAKLIFSVVFSLIMLIGADHLVEWLKDRH
jgi:hypothetical protein